MLSEKVYKMYVDILKEELIPAMGCTEPIAVAYAAAKCRAVLADDVERAEVEVSGNIIKNVKSVVVPNTDGMRGIEAAAAVGIVAGDESRRLEVIKAVTKEDIKKTKEFLKEKSISVKHAETPYIFDINIKLFSKNQQASVRIIDYHTNIVKIEKNGSILFHKEMKGAEISSLTDRSVLNIKDIVEFANSVNIEDIEEVIGRQIEYNTAISQEGLRNSYGANIGRVILNTYGSDDIKIRAKAKAAAGSDARMNGCEMPVVINSGSGNQGITASVPVIEYANELSCSREQLYRALVISNLVTIHLKTGIGRLSAYCGAVSAGCGSGCGIAYLKGGDYKIISHTLVNSIAIVSGMICDGAKASCAAKIAASVDAGILGYYMYVNGQQFYGGDGIVKKGVENTIINVGRLAKEGMQETDREIIKLMSE
jgi:L-cysteine desulfidase